MIMQQKVMGGSSIKILDMQMNGSSADLMGHTVTDTAMSYDANNAILNGSTSNIVLSDSADFTFSNSTSISNGSKNNDFTIDIVFSPNIINVATTIMGKATSSVWGSNTTDEWYIMYDGNGYIYFIMYDCFNSGRRIFNAPITLNVATPIRVTFSFDDINLGKIYVNSNLIITSQINTSFLFMRNTSTPVTIGRAYRSGNSNFNGKIEYIKMFNKVYTPTEIDAL